MSTDFRALFDEHADELSFGDGTESVMTFEAFEAAVSAALAQPKPEGPSDADLYELADTFNGDPVPAMREALKLWGHPASPSAPPSERDVAEWINRLPLWHGASRDELTGIVLRAFAHWGCPATPPAPEVGELGEQRRNAVIEAVTEALGNAYDCLRVWEAWGVGTMGEDDFELVAENGERVVEIADAAIEAMRPAAPPAPEPGELGEVCEWLETHAAHLRKMQEIGAWPETELQEMLDRAATLQQQAAPAPAVVPVAVSERPWEKGGWTDLDGECWWCPPDGPAYWSMANPAMVYGGWLLPAHAIPVPQAGEVPHV
jgi:hypothetical protein